MNGRGRARASTVPASTVPASSGPASSGPASSGPATTVSVAPLPPGFRIELDRSARQLGDGSLFGGSPARVLRLTPAGQAALTELREGPVGSAAAGVLARRLTDAGLAHPVPPAGRPPEGRFDVTIVIPVRDRAAMLDRCLSAARAGTRMAGPRIVVVDDGSANPGAIAEVAVRHGALLRRRPVAGGPGVARNAGLAGDSSELVAFLDSDCVPPAGWISELSRHFADPLVGAVAPRVVPRDTGAAGCRRSAVAAYERARGSLDLGGQPARVVPSSRVAYVPTAALVVRRAALCAVAAAAADRPQSATGEGSCVECFDAALRYGEDVDLIWRLHAAGWRIRYEPSVQVPHESPASWPALLARRFRYGTSAAPLARRHPANMAPLVLQPWPAVTAAALLARRPAAAMACLTASWLNLAAAVRRAGLPADGAIPATLTAVHQTWLGLGRYATQFAGPALAIGIAAPGGRTARQHWGRRAAATALLLGPVAAAYRQQRPGLDPARFAAAHVADDLCYGAGVWLGCARQRTLVPVRPVISRRPLRIAGRPEEGER